MSLSVNDIFQSTHFDAFINPFHEKQYIEIGNRIGYQWIFLLTLFYSKRVSDQIQRFLSTYLSTDTKLEAAKGDFFKETYIWYHKF